MQNQKLPEAQPGNELQAQHSPAYVHMPPGCEHDIVFGLLGSGEMASLLSAASLPTQKWIVYAGNVLIIAANGVPIFWPNLEKLVLEQLGWPLVAFVLAVLAALASEVLAYRENGRGVQRIASTILSLAYVGLLMSFVVQLATSGGHIALLSLIIVVKMADTGAYTIGRLIGRHKMTPRLSPGKTWEGAGGAVAFAVIGSGISFLLLGPWLSSSASVPEAWRWILYAILIAIAGVFQLEWTGIEQFLKAMVNPELRPQIDDLPARHPGDRHGTD